MTQKQNLPNAVEEIFNIYDDDSLLKTFNNLNKNVNKDIENGFFGFLRKKFFRNIYTNLKCIRGSF